LGRQRELPEWYRPGSAPWFERGLGEKRVHPSAVRIDRQTIVDAPRQEAGEYRALWNEVQREAGYLLTRLLYLMQEQAYLRYGGHYRSGKIEMNRLWKQRRGDVRLFQRVIEGGRQEIAFSLLVDESASMGRQQKHRIAAKAAVLLGESLSRIEVPFEIIGYTTAGFEAQAALKLGLTPAYRYRSMRCTPLEHRVYKSFGEPYRFVRTRLAGIQPRHNNWDEEHLLFAQRRLMHRQEAVRVMVVLSDGQPNGDADHLIATVRRLERQGTTVIGIGIGADFVRQIYRDSIVVGDFRQLAQELIEILIRSIVYGSGRPASVGESSARGAARLHTAIADPTRASRE
jgi:cobalamin biosynthesis protein CobT